MTISYRNSSVLEEQVKAKFKQADMQQEYARAMLVRSQALELAAQYGLDKKQVSEAALLHNISRLIPETDYLTLAEEYGAEILPEERKNPHLLHQKISRILAVEEFNISDKEVLNAISCHTTLRPSATLLDKIIFLASKQYTGKSIKFFLNTKQKPLAEKDLNASVLSCLFDEINNNQTTTCIHPWAQKALEDLKKK